MIKSNRKKFTTDGNCQRCGKPYRKQAGLWICSGCGNMRSLDYESNPYYSRLTRHAPGEGLTGSGIRKLPTNEDE